MKIHVGQIYIQAGVGFRFSHIFQGRISEDLTALVAPSSKFLEKYGADFDLTFNMSAKKAIEDNEIRGPTIFRKDKDVEYSVFLPFDVIVRQDDIPRCALGFLLKGVCSVLEALDINTSRIKEREESIVDTICSDPIMFEQDRPFIPLPEPPEKPFDVRNDRAFERLKSVTDIESVHRITHCLYFRTRRSSKAVGDRLRQQGFVIEQMRSSDGTDWMVLATVAIVPTEETLLRMEDSLKAVAQAHKGQYDGWEVDVQENK